MYPQEISQAPTFSTNLQLEASEKERCPVGVNIAKTHDPSILGAAAVEDFLISFRTLSKLADFVVPKRADTVDSDVQVLKDWRILFFFLNNEFVS